MRWTDVPVHVIDFEGGIRTGVVEFGVVTLLEGRIRAVHTRVCRPRAPVSEEETRVHQLVERDWAGAEPFEEEWTRFAALRETGVLAAHFAATEQALLRSVWPCPRLSPDFLRPGGWAAEWGPWIDTGRIAIGRSGMAASAALGDVVDRLGLETALAEVAAHWCPAARRRYHSAPFDALASALVLLALARDELGEPWDLARALAESTADARTRADYGQRRLF